MTWISPKDAAQLLHYDVSYIRKQCKAGEYGKQNIGYRYTKGSKGRGGKQLQIALEALPEQAQAAYQKQHPESSGMLLPPTLNCRASGLRRKPWQEGHS